MTVHSSIDDADTRWLALVARQSGVPGPASDTPAALRKVRTALKKKLPARGYVVAPGQGLWIDGDATSLGEGESVPDDHASIFLLASGVIEPAADAASQASTPPRGEVASTAGSTDEEQP